MQCQKEFSITVNPAPAICVDWTTLGPFNDIGGSPVIIGSGTLGQGHPTGNSWTQFATTNAGGTRWQTLEATLSYHGSGTCDCNLELDCTGYGGTLPTVAFNIFAPALISSPVAVAVGITNWPFTLPDNLGVPYTVTIRCTTNASGAGGNASCTFTLTTV